MTIANASKFRVAYVTEATLGTTPATPGFTVIRATGESLAMVREMATSQELNGLRGDVGGIQLYAAGAGGVKGEYSHGVLDPFLESVLRNAWSTNVLTDGDTPKGFTLESIAETGATDVYKRLTGAEVDKLGLSLKANAVAEWTVDFMARTGAPASAIVAGATYTAGSTEPVIAGASIGSIALGGGVTVDALISVDINFAANLSPQKVLGSLGPVGFGSGRAEATGSLSLFLNSTESDVLTAFANGTHAGLDLTVGTVANKKLRIELPDIILENMKTAAESKNGDVIITTDWRAVQASTLSGAIARVTRNVP